MLAIGIDIGGTKVVGGVVDPDGRVLAQAWRDTPAEYPDKSLNLMVEIIHELTAGHPVESVGVGAAGWVDQSRSRVLFAPNVAWRDEPLGDRLTGRIGLRVVVENDANAAAWAEFRYGAARAAAESMLLLTVGTGIGGGLVLGGALVRGAHGIAGEPGHMRVVPAGLPCGCGRHGCLEQYASGGALVRYARTGARSDPGAAAVLLDLAGSADGITGPLVTRAARAGDPVSRAAFDEVGRWLGGALADLVALFDPEVIVVGGGVSEAGELLLAPARAAFTDELASRGALPVAAVVPASLGNLAGVVGAADLARR